MVVQYLILAERPNGRVGSMRGDLGAGLRLVPLAGRSELAVALIGTSSTSFVWKSRLASSSSHTSASGRLTTID